MSIATLFVPGPLPGLNEIIDAKANVFIPKGMAIPGRGIQSSRLPSEWTKMKKRWHGIIARCCQEQDFQPDITGGFFNYLCLEPHRRRDPGNVGCGAQKIIEDALIEAGRLKNDGWKFVRGFRHYWEVDARNPGVYLIVTQDRCMAEDEASAYFEVLLSEQAVLGFGDGKEAEG